MTMIRLKDKHGRTWYIVRPESVCMVESLDNGGGCAYTIVGYNLILSQNEKRRVMKWLEDTK